MKKKFYLNALFIPVILSIIFLFSSNNLNAHPSKNHKPMVCILEEDRTKAQKNNCKTLLFFHRLCKLDQDCAILKLEDQKKEIKGLEDRLGGVADCGDIPFNHKSNADTTVHQKPNADSDIVAKVKKKSKIIIFCTFRKK